MVEVVVTRRHIDGLPTYQPSEFVIVPSLVIGKLRLFVRTRQNQA
jgi:hypothetical protein